MEIIRQAAQEEGLLFYTLGDPQMADAAKEACQVSSDPWSIEFWQSIQWGFSWWSTPVFLRWSQAEKKICKLFFCLKKLLKRPPDAAASCTLCRHFGTHYRCVAISSWSFSLRPPTRGRSPAKDALQAVLQADRGCWIHHQAGWWCLAQKSSSSRHCVGGGVTHQQNPSIYIHGPERLQGIINHPHLFSIQISTLTPSWWCFCFKPCFTRM